MFDVSFRDGRAANVTAPMPARGRAERVMAGAVLVLGGGPPVMKLITAPPIVVGAARFWLALPVLLILTRRKGRSISVLIRRTAVGGLLFAANFVLFAGALAHASVAIVSVILALQPAVVLMAGRWLGERPTRFHLVCTGIGIAGVFVVVLGGDVETRGDGLGLVLCVLALLAFAGYYVMNRRMRVTTDIGPVEWMSGVVLVASIAMVPVALLTTSTAGFRELAGLDFVYLGFVTIVVGTLGQSMLSWVQRFIPASRSSLYFLGVNVVSIVVAWPMHHEPVNAIQGAGCAIVLGAVALIVRHPASVHVDTARLGTHLGVGE